MQRKNNLLENRKGMAMLMAIFMILILGGIMAIVITMTSNTSKRTQDQYLHEQALLLTRSATEYALLAVSGHEYNATNGCINTINMQYPNAGATAMFDINITLSYVGFNGLAGCNQYIATVTAPESNGTILMDVVVTDHNLTTEPIRYHRRTLQKM